MSKHSLAEGAEFINNLRALGQILNYHIELELPIDGKEKRTKAVDVAWFKESHQKFPLFIFEVESNVTNGAAYNPLKVFAERNESFEKPLFFFQVFLHRGQESSKIVDLRNQFGAFNYRVYRMSTKEKQTLILDVLSQHRRISSELAISKLFDFLIRTQWLDVDLQKLAVHIETLDFEKATGTLLSSYVYLSSIYPDMIPITCCYLTKIHRDYYSNDNIINYGTYLGNTWHYPIHLGIIFSETTDLYIKNKIFQQLKEWQEKSVYLTMLGPHFGLSYDYDNFIVWGSGGLFALLSTLFKGYERVILYLVDQLKIIIDGTPDNYRIPNLLWLLHIIPRTETGTPIYENYILPILQKLGCFSVKHLLSPPFLDTDPRFIETFLTTTDEIPTLAELDEMFTIEQEDRPTAVQTASYALTTPNEIGLNFRVLQTVHSR